MRNFVFGLSLGSWACVITYITMAFLELIPMPNIENKWADALAFPWLFFTGIVIFDFVFEKAEQMKEAFDAKFYNATFEKSVRKNPHRRRKIQNAALQGGK